ncbi:hypothetical protein DMC47_13985 [Nostoc sp. 3335mG]|nr:hypothetical protein DMC47_13985 [Nostoc sp. 3335mG]
MERQPETELLVDSSGYFCLGTRFCRICKRLQAETHDIRAKAGMPAVTCSFSMALCVCRSRGHEVRTTLEVMVARRPA